MEPENQPFWKRRFLLETIIFRFHVKLWGCMFNVCFVIFSHLRFTPLVKLFGWDVGPPQNSLRFSVHDPKGNVIFETWRQSADGSKFLSLKHGPPVWLAEQEPNHITEDSTHSKESGPSLKNALFQCTGRGLCSLLSWLLTFKCYEFWRAWMRCGVVSFSGQRWAKGQKKTRCKEVGKWKGKAKTSNEKTKSKGTSPIKRAVFGPGGARKATRTKVESNHHNHVVKVGCSAKVTPHPRGNWSCASLSLLVEIATKRALNAE